MGLLGSISQNTVEKIQSITFSNPSVIDSITYSKSEITYPAAKAYKLSKSDFNLFFTYYYQFYTSLIINFPSINPSFSNQVPVCQIKIHCSTAKDAIQYFQTSKPAPDVLVYDMSYDRVDQIVIFAERPTEISITLQEYLMAFQIISLFANQVSLN